MFLSREEFCRDQCVLICQRPGVQLVKTSTPCAVILNSVASASGVIGTREKPVPRTNRRQGWKASDASYIACTSALLNRTTPPPAESSSESRSRQRSSSLNVSTASKESSGPC